MCFIFATGDALDAEKDEACVPTTFFQEFPRVSLVALLRVIFYFTKDDSQRRIAETLKLSRSLVSRICRRLQDICSVDLQQRPIIPFGGAAAVVKCDESKFNHKAKVNLKHFLIL